ncbi:Carbohydrate ABC transporter membrane protein 2, CUT1 family [[Clostridium] ultunense Esp]|nr:Carbohydrate ABC transporter membrane protein 2, CUT1 family [[Clostridium] ultunense Esp]
MVKKKLKRIGLYAAVLLIVSETLLPFAWLFISSIMRQDELLSEPIHWLPEKPTFERYNAILFGKDIEFRGTSLSGPTKVFRQSLVNSFVISGTATLLAVGLGTIAGYAFSRLKFLLKEKLLLLAVAVQMLPPITIVVPLYILAKRFHLTNSTLNLIIIYAAITVTYVIWVMVGFFNQIPKELEESARIDGCSRWSAMWRVVLPISGPGLVATGILTFLTVWNEFLFALTFINDSSAKTISLAIGEFSVKFSVDYGMMTAGGVLSSIPPVLIALIFQRFIVQGLTSGSVKG